MTMQPGNFDLTEDVISVTDLKVKVSSMVDDVVDNGATKLVVRHGKPAAVILSVDQYRTFIEAQAQLERLEMQAMYQETLGQHERGETLELANVYNALSLQMAAQAPATPKEYRGRPARAKRTG